MNRESQAEQAPQKVQLKRRKKHLRPAGILLIALAVLIVGVPLVFGGYLLFGVKPPEVDTPAGDENPVNYLPPEIVDTGRREGVYSFLIVGLDHPDMSRNTDVLMLCNYDTTSGSVNIMQIPRDTYVVDELCPAGGKINNIYNLAARSIAEENPNLSQTELETKAMKRLCAKISALFCVPVDFYIAFDTVVYRELLEIVCPITIDVPFDMDYDDSKQGLHIHLKAGVQELNAEQAEGFSRFRQNNGRLNGLPEGDFSRVDLQKMVLAAIAKKLFSEFSVQTAVESAQAVWKNLKTDLSENNCIWFIKQTLTLYASGTLTLDDIRMYDLPCKVPTPAECGALLGLDYSIAYGFMETSFGYTLTILNRAFNVYNAEITEEMLGYEEAVDLGGYCDHSDTEGQSLQGTIDNPPDLWISHY